MSLDLADAGAQVARMATDMAAQASRMREVPRFAADLLREWHDRPQEARSYLEGLEQGGVWPFAPPLEPLLTIAPAIGEPPDYAVIATDGSQIDVDSHGLVQCFLINVGWAGIAYGLSPMAQLSSRPRVYYHDDELYPDGEDGQRQEAGGQTLALLRTVAELERLAELAEEWQGHRALVALADGSLVRWEFGGKRPDPFRAGLLKRFAGALARFRAMAVPVCSYISRPNAREVANAAALLAVHGCDRDSGGCRRCAGLREPLCELLRLLPDRTLLSHLGTGERSALFRSLAPVLGQYHPDDRIVFFYLNTGREVARVEVPRWAARDETLARIQAVLVGQSTRGHGYPVVLMEAHEQAVIHGPAREAFRRMVLAALNAGNLEASVSPKRWSKDRRAV
jgi:hypothetical protein